jgi:hypothetical protein
VEFALLCATRRACAHRENEVPIDERGLGLDCQLQLRARSLAIMAGLQVGACGADGEEMGLNTRRADPIWARQSS